MVSISLFLVMESQFVQGVNRCHCLQPQATVPDEYQSDLAARTQITLMYADPGGRSGIYFKGSNAEMGAGGRSRNGGMGGAL